MRATTVEANRAMINEMPRGINIRPSIPLKKNKGTKLTIMMSVELSIGMRTSLDASKITSIGRLRSLSGNRRFSSDGKLCGLPSSKL